MKKILSLVCISLLVACGSNGGSGGGSGKGNRERLIKPIVTNEINQSQAKQEVLDNITTLTTFELGATFTRVFDCDLSATGQRASSQRELTYKLLDFEANTGRLKFLVEVTKNNDQYECLSELVTNNKYYIVNTFLPQETELDFYLGAYSSFYNGRLQNVTPVLVMRSSGEDQGVRSASEFGILMDRPLFSAYYSETDFLFVQENVRVRIQAFNEARGSIGDIDTSGLQEFSEEFFKAN